MRTNNRSQESNRHAGRDWQNDDYGNYSGYSGLSNRNRRDYDYDEGTTTSYDTEDRGTRRMRNEGASDNYDYNFQNRSDNRNFNDGKEQSDRSSDRYYDEWENRDDRRDKHGNDQTYYDGGTYGNYQYRQGYDDRGGTHSIGSRGQYYNSGEDRYNNAPSDRQWQNKAGYTTSANNDMGRTSYNNSQGYNSNNNQYGQHRGKGPKGYKRSDERIKEDINDRLTDDSNLDASGIEVSVKDSEVILSGTVEDRHFKRYAEDLAEMVSGVQNVENRIRVKAAAKSQPETDARLQKGNMDNTNGDHALTKHNGRHT